jgi:murein DD-endopeptidase MepM/ murein hydrolase activator NlpD
VDKYDRVSQGDVIGYVGKTGSVKTPQLFFSLRNGKQAIDPAKYMSNEVAGL